MTDSPNLPSFPMPTVDPLMEFRLVTAEQHIKEITDQNKALEIAIRENRAHYDQKIQEIKDYSEAVERNRLKWGISTLGTLVSVLVAIVWNYRGAIFKGGQ